MTRLAYSWVDVPEGEGVDGSMPTSAEDFARSMGYESMSYGTHEELMAHADHEWIVELREVLLGLLDKSRSVLSVGSGKCEHEAPLAEAGFDITASDLSLEPLEDARRLVPALKVRRYDALAPDVRAAYDDLLATGLDYALDDDALNRFLVATRDVVRPGGRLILVHRFQDTPATWLIDRALLPLWAALRRVRYRLRRQHVKVVRREHGYRRTRREIRAAAERAQWRVGSVQHAGAAMELSRLPLPGVLFRAARGLDRRWYRLNNATVVELVS